MVFLIQLLNLLTKHNWPCIASAPPIGKKVLEDIDFSDYWEDGEWVLSILMKLPAVSIRIVLGLAYLLFGEGGDWRQCTKAYLRRK